MSTLVVRLVSLILFATLCAVGTFWVTVIMGRNHTAPAAAPLAPPPSTQAAAELFGGSPAVIARQEFKVIGILSLGPGKGSAAIIASTDGPTHTVAAGQHLDGDTRLSEVRQRSVILERGGVKSEIFLPVANQANGYLR
jgi:general secretion pathway protein C